VNGTTLHSRDTTYTYDSLGNRTDETTYAGPGQATYNAGVWTFAAPGNGSAARTTTTSYNVAATGLDESFSGLPVKVDQPPATTGATPLSEQAAYDYRLGVITSVTDPNGNVTSAEYDIFGRMITLSTKFFCIMVQVLVYWRV
jgi:YD repeat-containing protein